MLCFHKLVLCWRVDDSALLSTEVKWITCIFPRIISRVMSVDENSYIVGVACIMTLFIGCDYVYPILLLSAGVSPESCCSGMTMVCCIFVSSSSSAYFVLNHLTLICETQYTVTST